EHQSDEGRVDGERAGDAGGDAGDHRLVAARDLRDPHGRTTWIFPSPACRSSTSTRPEPVRSMMCERTCVPLSFRSSTTESPACTSVRTSIVALAGTVTFRLPIPTVAFTNVWPFGSVTSLRSTFSFPIPSVYFEWMSPV